ncbi:GntR family transcriptional regulator [Streptomyces albofaciens JCM 4342]|uniref:TetR/AcrR family transcriptional regulator C-terminal domain-containing protein n=1 Tax=Streptomyces albofaciens TaxID=66866 RepID=UPI001239134C|nr:TetR/AcrR family transcriptional regulator C-terminal domain-containing protein [Streptomyces albofaciens]KAA6223908.1 GntR family transcriptional regulator [Streptomyces albofaciens JCM 4342]
MTASRTPPYQRIVHDIRRRIAEGELAPGDRIPSTRQLARDWNVALATATKALTVLRQEETVHTQARVGTVVAPVPGRSGTARHTDKGPAPERELSRDGVVRAAIAIADAEGLAALSMRGVAARLGTAAMSPYRYVNGKDDLVLLMADTVFGELPRPAGTPADWRARLEAGARALWALHRAHPWLAQTGSLTRPLLLPNMLAYSEWMLSALDGHGLGPATMLDVNVLLYAHVQGLAVHLEREAQARGATGLSDEQWLDTQADALTRLIASGAYPTFARVVEGCGTAGYDLDLDALFALGLRSLLDGVSALVDAARTGRRLTP